jgi:hypothetical protein
MGRHRSFPYDEVVLHRRRKWQVKSNAISGILGDQREPARATAVEGGSAKAVVDVSFQRSMANYLRDVAAWRRRRYQDDLRDARNLQSAAALEQLADFVLHLPADSEPLLQLAALTIEGGEFIPGQQTAYEIGRFRFYNQEATFDGFLAQLVELARADRGEHGRFGGPQVPDDNPWG